MSCGKVKANHIPITSTRVTSESDFESAAMKELAEIADAVDGRVEDIGADSVDFHEGVLTIEFPKGTFVINKHQASRQIWFSSPVSVPGYFDLYKQNGTGVLWWSSRLETTLRSKLSVDIHSLSGRSLCL
jgi:frataxin-like iron-binding protein CyaY